MLDFCLGFRFFFVFEGLLFLGGVCFFGWGCVCLGFFLVLYSSMAMCFMSKKVWSVTCKHTTVVVRHNVVCRNCLQ